MNKETVYPLRLPDELKHNLSVIASRERRSMAWVIRDILQNYVNTRKSQTQNDAGHLYTKEITHGS